MNDVQKQWLETLKTGDYQQVEGSLRCDNGYCCLGVLTDLYLKAHGEEWEQATEQQRMNDFIFDDGVRYYVGDEASVLPAKVQEWAGLPDTAPRLIISGTKFEEITGGVVPDYDVADDGTFDIGLTELNDEWGMPFKVIAQLIENGTLVASPYRTI